MTIHVLLLSSLRIHSLIIISLSHLYIRCNRAVNGPKNFFAVVAQTKFTKIRLFSELY